VLEKEDELVEGLLVVAVEEVVEDVDDVVSPVIGEEVVEDVVVDVVVVVDACDIASTSIPHWG
jgi:hypothetical protein